MGGPLQVWEGGGDRAKFARGRWTPRLSACFARSVRMRARGKPADPAEVRVNGVHGRNGPLSWVHQEGEFVGFLQLVQLLVTIAIGNRRIFFLSCLFTKHSTGTTHSRGRACPQQPDTAWMRCKQDGTDTKISRRRVGVQGVGRDWWSEGEFCQEDTPIRRLQGPCTSTERSLKT